MGAEATLKLLLLGEDRTAGRALKGVGDQAEKTHSKLAGVAHTAGVVLAGGLLAAGAAAIKLTKGAAEDEAAQSKLAQTMQKAAGATKGQVAQTENWITAQGKAYGVTDDDLRPALAKLVVATHDVGKAQHLASLAMDVSAGTGKDLGAVSMALAKAQNGNVGALGRLGIATKDADGKTKSLHQITKDLAATYGGAAAKAADTTAGKQKILTTQLSEAGETIGYKLLPFMLKLTEAGTAALGWMTAHGKLVAIIAGAVGGLAVAIVAINAAVRAWTAAQLALNAVLSANPIGLIVVGLALLVGGLILAYKKSETFRDIVNGAFGVVKGAIGFLMDHWKLLITLILGPFGLALVFIVTHFDLVKSAFHAVGVALGTTWNTLIAPVFEFFGKAIGAIMIGWGKLLQAIGNVPGFGWVGKLGDKLVTAGGDAMNLNLALDKVAKDRTANITIKYNTQQLMGAPSISKPRVPHSAVGASFFEGGITRVGERGPENVWLPRGSAISTAADSARMMSGGDGGGDLGTLTVVVTTDTGEVIEQKLARLKRRRGGATLEFA